MNTTASPVVTSAGAAPTTPTTPDPLLYEPPVSCLGSRYWSYFLASSLITFFAGLIIVLAARLLTQLAGSGGRRRGEAAAIAGVDGQQVEEKVGCPTRLKWYCEGLISGQTVTGRIVVSLSCILSIGSLIIYLVDVTRNPLVSETCQNFKDSPTQIVDFAFNIVFLLMFFIRLIAANDKLSFWLEIPSFVDYFTIPPSIVGAVLSRQWLGLRFLRALRIMSFPDILQFLSLLRTSNSIRLAQLSCILISTWLAASGFIHLVETSGDPFHDFDNAQNITYWEAVYLAVVTMSTVGYGDLYCVTTIGRAFMIVFILIALAMFASFIPEIMEILGRREKYGGYYDKPTGLKHIVLCGHITYDTVHNFLRDFLHEDRENQNIKCLFLDNKRPDLELEALFKRNFTQVNYFRGTVMNTRDLERVRLQEADACLVLANPRGRDPDSEDAANIMRVISIKNYFQDIRVIVQLIRYTNKAFCVNLPSWTSRDQVLCLAEMKLGFMAQGCLAPGFSTLLANLFAMRSYKKSSKCLQWQDHYMRGAGAEVYHERLSSAFHGKTFPQAAEICFTKLKLLLLAVSVRQDTGEQGVVLLNPGTNYIIDDNTDGFFVCQSEDEAKRAGYFCVDCHTAVAEAEYIKPCPCPDRKHRNGVTQAGLTAIKMEGPVDGGFLAQNPRTQLKYNNGLFPGYRVNALRDIPEAEHADSGNSSASEYNQGEEPVVTDVEVSELFDHTGLFHWSEERKFDDALLGPHSREVKRHLDKHIVLCVFNSEDDPVIGLCNFVMPLRASCLHRDELRTIVIVGDEAFLKAEWESIATFPDVYIKPGSPLNRADLRDIQVHLSSMVVVLTTNDTFTDDTTLVDKEAILCSLNIKTMSFRNLADLWKGSNPRQALGKLALLKQRSSGGTISHRSTSGACIPMLTELANDYNVQFLDQDDEDDPDIPLAMTQPFACGRAFAASLLDTLLSTTYFNGESLSLIRMLITGGSTTELEQILAEGEGLARGALSQEEIARVRSRSRVALLPLEDGILSDYQGSLYAQLFVGALRQHGILCIGLYRLLDPRPSTASYNRYIITNPPAEFNLFPSDKVYCLQPFSTCNYGPTNAHMQRDNPPHSGSPTVDNLLLNDIDTQL